MKSKRGSTLFPTIYKYSGAIGLEKDKISHILAELFPQKGEQFSAQSIAHLAGDVVGMRTNKKPNDSITFPYTYGSIM
jgi:hypothetical protein